ncbi:MAG: RNA-directed DNA polymerase, partial [Proteobacteria bacterium]
MSLTIDNAKRAILHLSSLGDTDIFPPPFEFRFYKEAEEDIAKSVSQMTASNYKPISCFECLSPKGELSFRIAHQLYPADTLLYTAAAINVAPAIEKMKLPIDNGPFSYRFMDKADSPRLFAESSNFHDWLAHVKSIYGDDEPFPDAKHVIETDISDFYSRIYFHRLEHVLDDCEASNAVRKIIEGIIKTSRARQSYGLPVGTAASRILAEGLLTDTDAMISQICEKYSRYVDDFRIVVGQVSVVHSTLCQIAEHLMLTEGLSLNASKTKTATNQEGIEDIDKKLTDVFNDNELVQLSQHIRAVYDGEDVSIEDIQDIDEKEIIGKLYEVKSRKLVDYNAVKVILKALRTLNVSEPVELVEQNLDLLYYTPRDFCFLIGSMVQREPNVAEEIAALLEAVIQKPPFK